MSFTHVSLVAQMAHACTTYKGIEGKPFSCTHCWVMLANHLKWHAHEATKAQKMQEGAKVHSSPAACNGVPNDATSNASTEIPRSIGMKAAKVARARGSPSSTSVPTVSGGMYATHLAKLSGTKKIMVELKKEHIEVLSMKTSIRKDDQDEHIMKIDLTV